VDPTTAGVSVPGNDLDLNVAALGAFNTANNSCALGGNAIPLPRPASGTSIADICLFSQSGLDISMTYTVSGSGDVAVIAKLPAGLGIIHLTLQIPAAAASGARTLFIQNTNLDKTAASGCWRCIEMSFVQRRRFLWILFLAGLALLAIAANATTLSRLRFEELVKQATGWRGFVASPWKAAGRTERFGPRRGLKSWS